MVARGLHFSKEFSQLYKHITRQSLRLKDIIVIGKNAVLRVQFQFLSRIVLLLASFVACTNPSYNFWLGRVLD